MKSIIIAVITILILSVSANARKPKHRQSSVPVIVFKEIQEDGQLGSYHIISNPEKLSPIEQKMEEANFCEIDGEYILVPNCASERFDDGSMPIDETTLGQIRLLLENNVIGYSHLQDKYNTPLKIKRFKQTDDYNYLKWVLEQDKTCFLNGTYYAVSDVNSVFDLQRGTFTIATPFSYGNGICLRTFDKHFRYNDFITPKIDEDTAYKIECNPSQLIVFVKFTGVVENDECICEPLKVYIADKNTGEIYYEYTSE